MKLVKEIKKITSKKIVTLFSVVIICFGIIGGCGANDASPDLSDPDNIVNNFLFEHRKYRSKVCKCMPGGHDSD